MFAICNHLRVLCILCSGLFCGWTADAQMPVSFKKQVAPILASFCVACHNAKAPQSGLSLATYAALMKGGRRGKAVIPGNAEQSPLVQFIEGRKQPRMPLGGALKPEEIALIKRWIAEGAKPDGDPNAPVLRSDANRKSKIENRKSGVLPQAASLAWSKDGRWLAVGAYQEVKLFDGASGKLARTLKGHADVVRALAFSPDGAILAAGGVPGEGGEIKLWNTETGALLRTFQGHADCIYSLAWRPDGKQFATASYDKTVKLWEAEKGAPIADLTDHADAVYAAAYSADGKFLATAGADRSIKIWDAAVGKRLYTLAGHTDIVTALAFHPTADQLASTSADRSVRVWNLKADGGEQAKTLSGSTDVLTDVRFSPDGRLIAASGSDGTVKLWDAEKGEEARTISCSGDAVLAIAFHPNGQALAVGGYDGSVKIYKVSDGALAATLIAAPKRALQGK